MTYSKQMLAILLVLPFLAGAAGGLVIYPWLFTKPEERKEHGESTEAVKISPQARANLGITVARFGRADDFARDLAAALVRIGQPGGLDAIVNLAASWRDVSPVRYRAYWRTLKVPGQIVEREGNRDRLVSSRVAGVVKEIAAVRGDLVKPGAPLFTLDVVSEPLQNAMAGYHKSQLDLSIVRADLKRLKDSFDAGALPATRKIELDNQEKKLVREVAALEHELRMRGLDAMSIRDAAEGKFLTETIIRVPEHPVFAKPNASGTWHAGHVQGDMSRQFAYEIEDLKVKLGEQVQPGQTLCQLAHHYRLQIEGRAFEGERAVLQKAAKDGQAVWAEFPHPAGSLWPDRMEQLKISFFDYKVDSHQSLSFYVPLANEYQTYQSGGKEYRLWRFRPGQRAHVHVPIEKFENVFVLPVEAVAQEGAEAYLFRENGDAFERVRVHVRYMDRRVALIGSIDSYLPDNAFAMSGAVQLNWALKAQAGGEGGHGHSHSHEH